MNQIINYCGSVCDPLENIKLYSGAHLVMIASELLPWALHQMVFQEILPQGDINNVYTLLTRPSDKPKYDCTSQVIWGANDLIEFTEGGWGDSHWSMSVCNPPPQPPRTPPLLDGKHCTQPSPAPLETPVPHAARTEMHTNGWEEWLEIRLRMPLIPPSLRKCQQYTRWMLMESCKEAQMNW